MTNRLAASKELTKAAEAWIERVSIKKGYQPDAYPNPALAIHYAQLEALAFEQEFAEDEFNDATAPKLEMIHKVSFIHRLALCENGADNRWP